MGVLAHAAVARAAPRDFAPEVRALYDGPACGAPPPDYAAHCKQVEATIATWRAKWRDKAAPFFAGIVPSYPKSVVYPFGGGDLATALVVYPDAADYTTLSLEGIGDPRAFGSLDHAHRARELARLRTTLHKSLGWAWNTTIQLSIDSSEPGAALPVILVQALVALAANGYEPLEVRYFRPRADGTLDYLDDTAVAAADAEPHAHGHKQTNALQAGPFADVEIVFRARGDASAPKKIFRHVAADLSDGALARDRSALAVLERRGDVAAVTKAASYLLWKPEFSQIRDYLLAHARVMISDDTGIPPRYGEPAGFSYDVWGSYAGAHFDFARNDVAAELVALWKRAPARPLPFRFGYYDRRGRAVLMKITAREPTR